MLKFELIQTYKHSIKILLRRKKAPIFTSHKSYKNSLCIILITALSLMNLDLNSIMDRINKF